MLWIILTLMTVLAAVGLTIPLVRRQDPARALRNEVVEVLKGLKAEEKVAVQGAGFLNEGDLVKVVQ